MECTGSFYHWLFSLYQQRWDSHHSKSHQPTSGSLGWHARPCSRVSLFWSCTDFLRHLISLQQCHDLQGPVAKTMAPFEDVGQKLSVLDPCDWYRRAHAHTQTHTHLWIHRRKCSKKQNCHSYSQNRLLASTFTLLCVLVPWLSLLRHHRDAFSYVIFTVLD